MSALLLASDSYVYGTTYFGGACGVGTIFRMDGTGNATTIHSFCYSDGAHPVAGLIQSTSGELYGTATRGGTSNLGTIFRMDALGNVTTLHNFHGPDGSTPDSALIEVAGEFYGTTFEGGTGLGTIFKMDSNGVFATLHAFSGPDGASPYGALIHASDGNLYGTTAGGGDTSGHGTVFKMDASGTVTTLRVLNPVTDGANPYAPLLQGTDGYLYGTTSAYGPISGTIFRMDNSGAFTVLNGFNSDTGYGSTAPLIQAADGNFYGTTGIGGEASSVFRMDPAGALSVVHRFDYDAKPYAGLLEITDGGFLGTAASAGDGGPGPGAIFHVDSVGGFSTMHTFQSDEPVSPQTAPIEAADGSFYGTTAGGEAGAGTIYRMDSFGSLTTLHAFDGPDGASPVAPITQANNGKFYGTTEGGGTAGYGTVFAMEDSGALTTLHHFDHWDGANPHAALLQANDGNLYGTTFSGGAQDEWGTVFRIDTLGNLTTLHSFTSLDGAYPEGGLVQAADGNLYGTTAGTVFELDSSGVLTTLHEFDPFYGYGTVFGLIQAANGNLYGTTSGGGDGGAGTVYGIEPSGLFGLLHSFHGGDGANPSAALLRAADGNFYGTTIAGGASPGAGGCVWSVGCGTVFRIDASGYFVSLHSFNILDGRWPMAALTQASDGNLYGTTNGGGPFGGLGVVFRLSTAIVAVNEVSPMSGSGSGGAALALLGGGFSPEATVTVGSAPGTDVTVPDPTFLYFLRPALSPGTLNDVSVTNPGASPSTAMHPNAFFSDFLDVSQLNLLHDYIEKIFRAGITAGCGEGSYCPDDTVTRAQMAVFLLKAEHGSAYVPPVCTSFFGDVTCPSLFADWIEQLASEGITAGCGGGNFCPSSPVTRAQMAVFLLKTEHGPAYQPPACLGVFADVECLPTPAFAVNWIEQLASESITAGCGGGNYCPNDPNTRGQMAVFLVKTFGL